MLSTELELYEELYEAARSLLRYDGIDKARVILSMKRVDVAIEAIKYFRENDEHQGGEK